MSTAPSIRTELKLPKLIEAAVNYVFDRAFWSKEPAASATGDRGAASATGKYSVALAVGEFGRAKACAGSGLVLAYRDPDTGALLHLRAFIAGRDGIEADTWYRLTAEGEPEALPESEI